jgi:hypothetical protein
MLSRKQLRSLARTHATQSQPKPKPISQFGGRANARLTTSNLRLSPAIYLVVFAFDCAFALLCFCFAFECAFAFAHAFAFAFANPLIFFCLCFAFAIALLYFALLALLCFDIFH